MGIMRNQETNCMSKVSLTLPYQLRFLAQIEQETPQVMGAC